MGAKLTKTKSVSILGKSQDEQQQASTSVEKINNHLDVTTIENNKQSKKKNKKKKEQKSNKKSSTKKVDKSTSTESFILSLPASTEQLVCNQMSTMNNIVLLNTNTAQVNTAYQPEIPNKDIEEFRNACIRNGIMPADYQIENKQTLNEQEYQINTLNITEESLNNTSVAFVGNSNQVYSDEEQQQQQQSIES
ncbi:unnamed protein product [Rotaria sp. Silwood2]|nr:unnamed protein product [Rotaria sp. Silwood2]CAF2501505.1 unnamed protein product [Rotaria sp. Silwood2]CAF2732146.1 unnamed protein product [Rotaria sp. Silwood2]CAF2964773.1 unnamed protein product [Rotaria sp. Silwood2]CAF4068238.1 unnamed protein product [Rotaria sp. Silwood2]